MISVNGITKAYGKHEVLKGVSFSVGDGEIYGLIGKNGAGKTTLLNILAGLLDPKSGDYRVGNNDGPFKVGYLPDLPAFFEYLTSGEYLDFLLGYEDENRRKYLLELVGVPDGVRVNRMSRGMRQRLGIAAAIVNNPDVILLDEPTSALDPAGRHDVMAILKKLKNDGKSIIFSTHILADMERMCDTVGFLADGVIKREVTMKDALENNSAIAVRFLDVFNEYDLLKKSDLKFEVVSENELRILLSEDDSQHRLFSILSQISVPVAFIKRETQNLDSLFEEVCR